MQEQLPIHRLTIVNVACFLLGRDKPGFNNAAYSLLVCCNDILVNLSQPKKTSLHHLSDLRYNTCVLGKQWFCCLKKFNKILDQQRCLL
jgi:hypothetical protein